MDFRRFSAHPEHLRQLIKGAPERDVVIVDEIQRVPELLNVIHGMMESSLSRKFVMTGSSARKLRRGGVNLLAGRALHRTLHPFMAAELEEFDLEQSLRRGLLPLVLASDAPADVLEAYATLYLEEEVKVEGLTRNVGAFARFLEAASFSHGAVLNVSNIARESQVERKTAEGYLHVLEDLLLAFQIPVFTKRAKRRTAAHRKFYLFDAGVYRTLRPRGPLDRAEEIDGAALEGLVAQHLKAWIAYGDCGFELHYWRTRAKAEVDFVVYGETGFWAIEVKNADRLHPADFRALKTFHGDYPESVPLIVYRGSERLRIDDVWCIPAEEFLKRLQPGSGLIDWLDT